MGIELASPCILWCRARTVSFELPPKQTEEAKKQRSLSFVNIIRFWNSKRGNITQFWVERELWTNWHSEFEEQVCILPIPELNCGHNLQEAKMMMMMMMLVEGGDKFFDYYSSSSSFVAKMQQEKNLHRMTLFPFVMLIFFFFLPINVRSPWAS